MVYIIDYADFNLNQFTQMFHFDQPVFSCLAPQKSYIYPKGSEPCFLNLLCQAL